MSKIINLKINSNSDCIEHTSNKKLESFTLNAPVMNLLPYELWKNNYRVYNLEEQCYEDCKGYIHYDFSKITKVNSNKELFTVMNIQNICDLKPGIYTISFEVCNVIGKDLFTNIECYLCYKKYGINDPVYKNIGYFNSTNGINSLTFTIEENIMPLQINICRGFLNNYVGTRDLSFDFYFLGLTKGNVPITRQSNTFSETPQIFTENTLNTIGEYELSNNIRRHLNQIERHISTCEEKFN